MLEQSLLPIKFKIYNPLLDRVDQFLLISQIGCNCISSFPQNTVQTEVFAAFWGNTIFVSRNSPPTTHFTGRSGAGLCPFLLAGCGGKEKFCQRNVYILCGVCGFVCEFVYSRGNKEKHRGKAKRKCACVCVCLV